MRSALDLCSLINHACYRTVVALLRKRVRLIAVVLVLSLLMAALPASSGSARTIGRSTTARIVGQESLPLQFYRGARIAFAAIGMWMGENLLARAATSPPSTYEPVTAYLSPAPPFIDAPTNLTVTAASDTALSLSWTAPAGSVDHYQIERSQSVAGPFLFRANSSITSFQDTSVTTDQAYLYRIRAVTSGGLPSGPSTMALGTATSFEFNGVALVGNPIKKQHVYDIRTAINAVRTVAGLTAATWTRSDLTNLPIEANDFQELRTKLGEALTLLGISVAPYTDPTLNANVTLISGVHVDELQVRSTRGSSNSFGPLDPDSSSARLDPLNETGGGGENPLSRNFNWNLPLVELTGRSGLNLGLTLSYNSLVWTRIGNSVSFDDDDGFPGPGFRLGFPVIQQAAYFNSEVGKNAYLLIGSDGGRTELRQVSTSGAGATLFEAADSSHLLLDTTTTPFTLRTSDGTQMTYQLKGTEYQCTKIMDRNGNYITITYTTTGRIAVDEIVDTLGRHIDFVYDANGWLTQIKQLWNSGAATQYWARFTYTDVTIDTNFPGLTIFGPADNTQVKMLSKVTLADDSHYDFSYTSWGQVWKITNFGSDNNPINYRSYDLPQTGSLAHQDCPRFTARKDWAKYWNGDTDGTTATAEEVTTAFIVPVSDSWTMPDSTPLTGVRAQVTAGDGTINKIYFVGTAGTTSGWSRGLPILVDTVSSGVTERRVATTWTQDNTSVSYQLNPRILEMNTYDPAGNRARTRVDYQQFNFSNGTSCSYPRDVFEYEANATTVLRTTRTNYNTNTAYSDRRILGLPGERLLYQGDVNGSPQLMSRLEFVYDESTAFDGTSVPVQHDSAGYASSFVGRANLTKVIRHNVSVTASTSTITKYNRAGSVISTKDASNHEVVISYTDSFSDSVNRNTFAYPTTLTDPDGYSSTSKYNFDFGAVTYHRTPQPNVTTNTAGPEETFTYDSLGRLQQVTQLENNAYTRFEYSTGSQLRVDTYTTIQDGLGEARSFEITDGAGRVIGRAAQHPGSTGGYSGQRMIYDVMGRLFKNSNPTETAASGTPFQWTTAGDDTSIGWLYTEQTYDWKGRPLRTTNPDGTYKEVAYAGCGCAGGQVATLTDEGTIDGGVEKRRQQKIYSDVLGRIVKTEILNWASGTVYSATVNTYNVRDQITDATRYAGPAGSGTSQTTTSTYDGYGRLGSRHAPEQSSGAATVWTYNADDTIATVTDARGAVTSLTYNGRHKVTTVSYSTPAPIPVTPSVSYTYDAAGNRMTMTDGMGSVTYTRDDLSRLTTETRSFTGVGNFTINYAYNLAGQMTSITDPFGAQVGYTHDLAGKVTAVTGSNFASVSTYASSLQYRAWGGLKSLSYGNSKSLTLGYDANLRVSTYEVPSVLKKGYTYYNDGRLKFTQDQLTTNSKFDRLYRYDHVGRITVALSGLEAREQGTTNDRPYNENMTYDAFGNLTLRDIWQWDRHDVDGPVTYTNNRRNGWTYDADGRLLVGTQILSYDAAGQVVSFGDATPFQTDQSFDGDGRKAKTVVRTYDMETGLLASEETTYLVHSTVLGEVLSEVSATGGKKRSFVHSNGGVMAIQTVTGSTQSVTWEHYDASGASYRQTNSAGTVGIGAERDPFGANAGLVKPFTWNPPVDRGQLQPFYTVPDMNSDTQGCVVDGIPMPCSMVRGEATVQCRDNHCGPIVHEIVNAEGERFRILSTPFMAFANGVSGYFLNPAVIGASPQTQADAFYNAARAAAGGATANDVNQIDRTWTSGALPFSGMMQNPKGDQALSGEQRKIVEDVNGSAKYFMNLSDDCKKYIQGTSSEDPSKVLDKLEWYNGITYFHGLEMAAGEGQSVAANRGTWTGMGRSSKRIVLGYDYFESGVGGMASYYSITSKQARVMVMLHELKHYMSENGHPRNAPANDPNSWQTWNQNILKKCMGLDKPL